MQENLLLEQLYWFFTSLHWTSAYPATTVTPQGKPTSDHAYSLYCYNSNYYPWIKGCSYSKFFGQHILVFNKLFIQGGPSQQIKVILQPILMQSSKGCIMT
jgi:hypothetical protein